jgi:hypothetical protein
LGNCIVGISEVPLDIVYVFLKLPILVTYRGHLIILTVLEPITVAARSKALNVFPAQTLGPWVRTPLEVWMSLCVYFVFVVFCIGSGIATGLITSPRSPIDCL